MTDKEALKLALEALEGFYEYGYDRQECFEHITAIKEALAEHAMREVQRLGQEIEQEPVAWLSTDSIGERHLCFDKPLDNDPVQPLYTAPPQRKPLTNGEIYTAYITATNQTLRATDERLAFAFARAIEAAHGIKEKK